MKSGHLFPGHIRGVEGDGRSSTSDLEGINLRCINARGPIRLTSLLRPPPVFLFLAAAVAPWASATAAPPLALNKPVVPSVFYDYSADEFTWSIEAVTGAIQYHWVQASSTRNPLTNLPTWTFTDSTAGTYTVKVAGVETGVGGVIVGPYSDSTSFIVLSPDPKAAAPTLALSGDNLTISGYAYQGATGYRIEITYPDSVPIVLTTTTDPAQTGLTDEGIYGVKVQTETNNHRTAYSRRRTPDGVLQTAYSRRTLTVAR